MRAYGVLMLLVVVVSLPAAAVPSGVEHYTTHATGHFNQDQYDDMIITNASGTAFLLLGTNGGGFQWKQLEEQEQGETVRAPEGWPAGSSLYVRENGKGYEVFTRDTSGKVHRFTTV